MPPSPLLLPVSMWYSYSAFYSTDEIPAKDRNEASASSGKAFVSATVLLLDTNHMSVFVSVASMLCHSLTSDNLAFVMPLGTVGGVDSAECASLLISALGGLSHVTASCLLSGLGLCDLGSLYGDVIGAGVCSTLDLSGAHGCCVSWSCCWPSCLVTSTSQGCSSLVALSLVGSALPSGVSATGAVTVHALLLVVLVSCCLAALVLCEEDVFAVGLALGSACLLVACWAYGAVSLSAWVLAGCCFLVSLMLVC